MQNLEREREQRRAQRHQRRMQTAQTELQNASLFTNLLIQLPPIIEANKHVIGNARHYLEVYSAKVLVDIQIESELDDDEEEKDSAEPEELTAGESE